MDIDAFWLDDDRIRSIGLAEPSTPFGQQLMVATWPQRYGSLVSSATYRGCITVLAALNAFAHAGMSLQEIDRLIEAIDAAFQSSAYFPPNAHQTGGAALTTANAASAVRTGLTSAQLVAAFESELIYAARLFAVARQREAAGELLP